MRACSFRRLAAAVCAAAVCAGLAGLAGCAAGGPASRTDFFMSTLVTQQAYGPRAEDCLLYTSAKTIHRLLEVDHTAADSTRFLHNAKNPLKCDVIVIDEMSMVDVLLFQSLLNALKPSCRIIMVGDEDQLPSVGAGNVLASVIASGLVPVVRLKEIFRQAAQSLIISNAHRIVEGLAPQKGCLLYTSQGRHAGLPEAGRQKPGNGGV